jgi:putative ABC transport system substrate-binding protein
MERRTLLAAIGACAVVARVARAQQKTKVWRVGLLSASSVASVSSHWIWGSLLKGLREFGYIEGKNLVVEFRSAEDDYARLQELAAQLVAANVDVIVVSGGQSVAAAQKATRTIPIVIATAGDPVGSGFVKSLASPGGNITGLSDVAADMGFKLLDTLLSAVPGLKYVGVLVNPDNVSHTTFMRSIEDAARSKTVKVRSLEARTPAAIDAAFAAMAEDKVQGAIALADATFNSRQTQIAELAARYRLPCISGFRQYVHAGGLMSYGPDFADNARRAASYVDRIFKGAKPADLPIEQARRFEFAVNLKTAKTLALTIPGPLLARADEIIQ